MNTFGEIYRLTDFGDSHGSAIGGVIDGMPSCLQIDFNHLREMMQARRPGQSSLTTTRHETDDVIFLSGLKENVTTGAPLAFIIKNEDCRSSDYSNLADIFRPGHADYTYYIKYGIRDHRGGGRASARETASRVVAGALAEQLLSKRGIQVRGYVSGIGSVEMPNPYLDLPDRKAIIDSSVHCPWPEWSEQMSNIVSQIRGHDSVGGRVSVIARGMPPGIGRPIFARMAARLAAAVMSINGSRGVEFGQGYASASQYGANGIDDFSSAKIQSDKLRIYSDTNHCGGLLGGITTGADITLSVTYKPTPTRPYKVQTFNSAGESVTLQPKGRHDPCIAIRAAVVTEAMVAMTLLDEILIAGL